MQKGKGSDGKGLGYNRIIPKFLQSYSHLLVGKKNQYSESHQLDKEDGVFTSVDQIEADGAVIVEKDVSKRKRAAAADDAEEGDEAPTVVEAQEERKFVDSSERFSSQRKPAVEVEGTEESSKNTEQRPDAAEAATGSHVFRAKKSKSASSSEQTGAADTKAAKKKKLLSFNDEDEG